VNSPKIKVKAQNNLAVSQKSFKSFGSTSFTKNVAKPKTCNEINEGELGRVEQASKSTQCINESSKSIQLLNETSMTIKAENPENSTKNVPLVSPVNHMMRRLTLNEKEKLQSIQNGDSASKSSTIRPITNKENIFTKEFEGEKKKVQVRSFSQNPKMPITTPMTPSIEIYNNGKGKIPLHNTNSPPKNENPLQKITNLVKEINELEGNGSYDLMRNYVLELEEKITDLKSSIELTKPPHKKPTIFFGVENKENKQIKEIQESLLNNIVSSAKPLIKHEQKEAKINIIQVQNLLNKSNSMNLKHQYPKSTTNADLQKKKFEFQNKPASIKIQTINPQEELIPEEPQVSRCQELSQDGFGVNGCQLMPRNKDMVIRPIRYYISNAVNSFYRPLNVYEDACEDNYFTQLCQEHMMQTFQSLHLSRNLFNNVENHCYEEKCLELTRKESHKLKRTLIFDLDETLVHCNESLDLPADVILPIMFPNGQKIEVSNDLYIYDFFLGAFYKFLFFCDFFQESFL